MTKDSATFQDVEVNNESLFVCLALNIGEILRNTQSATGLSTETAINGMSNMFTAFSTCLKRARENDQELMDNPMVMDFAVDSGPAGFLSQQFTVISALVAGGAVLQPQATKEIIKNAQKLAIDLREQIKDLETTYPAEIANARNFSYEHMRAENCGTCGVAGTCGGTKTAPGTKPDAATVNLALTKAAEAKRAA